MKRQKFEAIGTVIDIICEASDEIVQQAVEIFKDFEKKYSRFLEGNELAKYNEGQIEVAEISEEMKDLIRLSTEIHQNTDGYYSPFLTKTLEGMGYDKEYSFKDKGNEVGEGQALGIVPIEFGGLGKGYAIDKVADFFLENGVENFLINAGGDIRANGVNPNKELWKVYIESPSNNEEVIGWFLLENSSCASSSPSRRKWGENDSLHHLINPKLNKPANEMLAVHTQSKKAVYADAYSTALFAMGFEKAKQALLPKKLPVEALIIAPNGEFFKSEGYNFASL